MLDSDDVEEPENEASVEEKLEDDEEVDEDWRASDEREIKELANEVDADFRFFVAASDLKLGQSAMTKVCHKLIGNFYKLTSSR